MTRYRVHALWDETAGVWVARSDDIAGLATEAETWSGLVSKLGVMAGEIIALNNIPIDPDGGEIEIVIDERVPVAA